MSFTFNGATQPNATLIVQGHSFCLVHKWQKKKSSLGIFAKTHCTAKASLSYNQFPQPTWYVFIDDHLSIYMLN